MTDKATHTPLPCPFCGAQAVSARVDRLGQPSRYKVFCTGCLGRTDDAQERAEALTAWNTRADSHHRLVEALEDCVAVLTDPIVGTIYHDDPDWYQALDRAVTKARAALKEAGR